MKIFRTLNSLFDDIVEYQKNNDKEISFFKNPEKLLYILSGKVPAEIIIKEIKKDYFKAQ